MRSILEVVSEQLLYFYIAYKDMTYIQSQVIEVKESTQENKYQTYFRKHMFTNANVCAKMNRNICFFERAVGHGDDMGQSFE